MDKILTNKKRSVVLSKDTTGSYAPRFYWTKQKGKIAPSVLIKCGDCDEEVRIYHEQGLDPDLKDDLFEINGVLIHKDIWVKLFKEIKLID